MNARFFSLSGSAVQNIINSENHFSSLSSTNDGLLLHSETPKHSQLLHISHRPVNHVNSAIDITVSDLIHDILDQLIGIVSSVISNNDGQSLQSIGKGLNSKGLFSLLIFGEFFNGNGHIQFRITTSKYDHFIL